MPESDFEDFRKLVATPINVQKRVLDAYEESDEEKTQKQIRFNSNVALGMIEVIQDKLDHGSELFEELCVLTDFIVLVNQGEDSDKLDIISHRLKRPVSNEYVSGILQVLSEEII